MNLILSGTLDFATFPIASYVFFGLFVVTCLVEVIVAFLMKEKIRKIIKPLCLLFLSIALIIYQPTSWLVYCGALLGMIGDIFLIWKDNKKRLAIGMLAFLLGHICYIVQIILILQPLSWAYYVGGAFLIVVFNLAFYQFTKKLVKDGRMAFASNIYVSFLGSVAIAALVGCFLGHFDYLFLTMLGGLAFVGSDAILAYTIYVKPVKRQDFFIMAFYLIGQALIVLGLVFSIAVI